MVRFMDEPQPEPTAEVASRQTVPIDAVPEPANPSAKPATPWHVWAVGGVSLLWNAMGAADYAFTQAGNRAWIGGGSQRMGITPDEMIAYVDSFPTWLHGFWALGVWGAVIGSILLLLRRRQAVWSFAVSLLGLTVTQFHRALTPQPDWVQGDPVFNLALWSIASFLLVYAVSMTRKGALR